MDARAVREASWHGEAAVVGVRGLRRRRRVVVESANFRDYMLRDRT
jgi:hypothetical protein